MGDFDRPVEGICPVLPYRRGCTPISIHSPRAGRDSKTHQVLRRIFVRFAVIRPSQAQIFRVVGCPGGFKWAILRCEPSGFS